MTDTVTEAEESEMSKLIERTTIEIEKGEAGLFYATSPDIRGLLVAKPTLAECWADIPRAIAEIRALQAEPTNGTG